MKIVVLDSAPLDRGDLDWASIREFGELVAYESTASEQIEERIDEADIVLTNKVPLSEVNLNLARNLKLVSVLATGYDVVDINAAGRRGIAVANVPGYSAAFTAQTTIALLLELANRVGDHAQSVKNGEWVRSSTFSYWKTPLVELSGKTILVVGLGEIGRRVAAIAAALGMRVVAAQFPGREPGESPFPRVPVDEGFAIADVITLHSPLTAQTLELVNARRLALVDPGALIVNTARGALVNEGDVASALATGHLAGYGADVLSKEPPVPTNPLLTARNAIITPHYGWASPDARQRMLAETTANIAAFIAGTPRNVVN